MSILGSERAPSRGDEAHEPDLACRLYDLFQPNLNRRLFTAQLDQTEPSSKKEALASSALSLKEVKRAQGFQISITLP